MIGPFPFARNIIMANVIAVVDDLFFASKIRGVGEQAGVRVIFAKRIEDIERSVAEEDPALVIADLNSTRCNPVEVAARLKSDANLKTVPLLGFFSHVDVELQRRAKEAGFDQTITRSAFSGTIAKLFTEIAEANKT
jgi:PleD family two-component response regulator